MVVTGTVRDRLGYRRAAASQGDRVNLTQWLQYGNGGWAKYGLSKAVVHPAWVSGDPRREAH
jgi:hypothetical protein